ncbi:dTMP kinase [Alkalilimnicola ehrlichii]|uniref:Thymidylate kinase n=2 Tax=Alkalilimnicola ehrlichii TaxID=351052 RepID=A0A3E0WLI3_9GAMM|nr:dTMP kinase [Alkalilimnicola ehrlichii]RFA30002.1 dTMP kinase [Alkalilimnicola ehrlichii]RFA33820.1 dTMP kinase [Alkalilimnicola ehrlichii]
MFITVEGVEGAGKSTCLSYIGTYLKSAGYDPLLTREPGGTPLGEAVRGLLLGDDYAGMSSDTELLLMFAARAEHWASVISPAICAGRVVVSDRFTDATYAYQGGGRGIDPARISALEQWVLGEQRPDLTLLLDLPPEVGRERAARRGAPDRFEKERQAFFDRVRGCYLERARRYPDRIRIVDASQPLDAVQAQIGEVLREQILERGVL